MHDYRTAKLSAADRSMLDLAVKLTTSLPDVEERDLAELRSHGFDDVAIHDIVQVTGLFNYYNRLCDGLGVDPEPEIAPEG